MTPQLNPFYKRHLKDEVFVHANANQYEKKKSTVDAMCFYAYCGQNTSIKYTVKRYLVGANDLTKRFLNGHTFYVANQVRCIFLRSLDNYSVIPIKRRVEKNFRV